MRKSLILNHIGGVPCYVVTDEVLIHEKILSYFIDTGTIIEYCIRMDRTINQVNFTTKEGNILSVFFNAHDNLLVVDIVHANETGGHEIVRKILNEKRLLAHCQPSIEVGTTVEDKVNSEIQTERLVFILLLLTSV